MDHAVVIYIQHHGVGNDAHGGFLQHINKAGRVFGTGQLLFEIVESESVVYALIEDTAQMPISLKQPDIPHTLFISGHGGGNAGRTCADDGKLTFFHDYISFVRPVRI